MLPTIVYMVLWVVSGGTLQMVPLFWYFIFTPRTLKFCRKYFFVDILLDFYSRKFLKMCAKSFVGKLQMLPAVALPEYRSPSHYPLCPSTPQVSSILKNPTLPWSGFFKIGDVFFTWIVLFLAHCTSACVCNCFHQSLESLMACNLQDINKSIWH